MPTHRLAPEDLADFDHLVPDFITVTADLDDPRVRGRTTHSLTTILFVCVSAAMAGAKSVHAYGHFAEASWEWVRASLGPDVVGPEPVSHDTIGRLLQKLQPDVCEGLLAEVVRRRTDRRPEDQIAIDGRAPRGHRRAFAGERPHRPREPDLDADRPRHPDGHRLPRGARRGVT